jgi:hypothetical protein
VLVLVIVPVNAPENVPENVPENAPEYMTAERVHVHVHVHVASIGDCVTDAAHANGPLLQRHALVATTSGSPHSSP